MRSYLIVYSFSWTPQIEPTHLSASVLADNVSGPSLVPGGPLWSRNSSEDHQSNNDLSSSIKQTSGPSFPLSHSPLSRWSSSQSPPTSSHSTPRRTGGRRSQEVELIACLSELEQEVNSLRERALEGLTRLGRPAIPAGLYKALKTHFQGSSSMLREAKVLSSYTLNGLTFSTFTRHRGNSFILVRRPSLSSIPARIESILQTPANDTFFVTQYFLKPTSCDDPFEKYPVLQSSLWSQDLGQLAIVKPQDVESHFACLAFKRNGTESLAVVSLFRVFLIFIFVQINAHSFRRNAKFF